jgi:threonine/homoserine/homoserine lactone efflux protein
MTFFLLSIAFGIAAAAPVGPMSLLCMRRTLIQGWRHGALTALGISTSDAIYAAIAVLGLNGIADFIVDHKAAFHLLAGLFFAGFGAKTFFSNTEAALAKAENSLISLPYAFTSSVLMTFTNPLILMFFVTGFPVLTMTSGFKAVYGALTIFGVFLGSLAWTVQIVVTTSYFRYSISQQKQVMIDKITGVLLLLFGSVEIWKCLNS